MRLYGGGCSLVPMSRQRRSLTARLTAQRLDALPGLDGSLDHGEEWVRGGSVHCVQARAAPVRIAAFNLLAKERELVIELPGSHIDGVWLVGAIKRNPPAIKAVTAPVRFVRDGMQIISDCLQGIGAITETLELGVVGITLCFAAQDLLSQ